VPHEFGKSAKPGECDSCESSSHHANDDGTFKRHVGGLEVGNDRRYPYSESHGDSHKENDDDLLPRAANLIAKQDGLEVARADDSAGDGGSNAKANQERDEDEPLVHSKLSLAGMRRYNEFVSSSPTSIQATKRAEADFPTKFGHFRILGFEGSERDPETCRPEAAVAVVMGDIHAQPPLVRIHSQCLTGDVFHSLRCDCRQQLELALEMIAEAGAGILLYEQKEGRGIGLIAKLQAYELQDQGLDTVEANERLGFKADHREFELPAAVLRAMNVNQVKLISNNPQKVAALESAGIKVIERVPCEPVISERSAAYLKTKKEKLGHLIGD
jgi:GTP cyclohydrolase II